MRTIAIASEKGGVGKTTVAINLAAALAKAGQRVLIVDMDPQGFCAVAVAVPEAKIDRSILDCLFADSGAEEVNLSDTTWQITPNLDLAPSCRALSKLETAVPGDSDDFSPLTRALAAAGHRYDMCIIDCPAFPGVLTRYAIDAADEVIIPAETGYFSLHSLQQQMQTFKDIARACGRDVPIRAIANQYDVRTKAAREILAELRRRHDDVVLNSVINFNTKLKESVSYGQPIAEFAPGSMGARDFQSLARELLAEQPGREAHQETVAAFANRLALDADRVLATTVPVLRPQIAPAPAAPTLARTTEPVVAKATRDAAKSSNERVAPVRRTQTDHQRIDQKLEAIYGVNQTPDGAVFRTHSPGARLVQLAGDFNDWMPHTTPMYRLDDAGAFEAKLRLPPGRYRYRLVIDGRWAHDRDNPSVETSEYGEVNSVVEIK